MPECKDSCNNPLIFTWNLKHPFISGCFNWMMNQFIGNGCLTISIHFKLVVSGIRYCRFIPFFNPIKINLTWRFFATQLKHICSVDLDQSSPKIVGRPSRYSDSGPSNCEIFFSPVNHSKPSYFTQVAIKSWENHNLDYKVGPYQL